MSKLTEQLDKRIKGIQAADVKVKKAVIKKAPAHAEITIECPDVAGDDAMIVVSATPPPPIKGAKTVSGSRILHYRIPNDLADEVEDAIRAMLLDRFKIATRVNKRSARKKTK